MNCPCCTHPLQTIELGDATFHTCPECRGTLVQMANLPRMLRNLDALMEETIAFDHPIPILEDRDGHIACPQCAGSMEKFGYMEGRFITLDRCSSCWLFWLDQPEIEVAVQMYARAQAQTAKHQAERAELARSLSALFHIGSRDTYQDAGVLLARLLR